MLELIFLVCFAFAAYFVVKYLKSLDSLLQMDNSGGEVKKLTMMQQDAFSKLSLMKDIKFYFCIISGSYKHSVSSPEIIKALNKSRKFLILQYPFVVVMFLIPVLINVFGLK
tara:strand:- start:57 stop:392 length:336 start_codon:yes stop_codon:yes gene_type:complete